MKKVLMSMIIAIVMFGMSAAASWKWNQMRMAAADTNDAQNDSDKPTESDEPDAPEPPTPTAARRIPTDPSRLAASEHGDSLMPSSSNRSSGFDDTVQIASSLRERMTTVRERESQLAQRQAQLDLILKDLRAERAAMEELRKQVNLEFKATEEQITAAEQQRTLIEAQQQELQTRVTEVESVEKDGTKRLGSVYDGMASDKAAKILEEMVNSGKMDSAVKLLGFMKERQAAKVLGEFQDASLAAQLTEKLKGLKKPTAPPKG